jgi:hypothetical protein
MHQHPSRLRSVSYGKHLTLQNLIARVRQALHLLPSTLTLPLSEVILTPYMPVPETHGEEWDRLEPASALDALVELALHGEYNGLYSDSRTMEGLELRSAAVIVFDVRHCRHPLSERVGIDAL